MTTGDASIGKLGGGGPGIALSNGLGGIATGVFFLVQKLIDEGVATGTYDFSMLEAVTPGAPLKEPIAIHRDQPDQLSRAGRRATEGWLRRCRGDRT